MPSEQQHGRTLHAVLELVGKAGFMLQTVGLMLAIYLLLPIPTSKYPLGITSAFGMVLVGFLVAVGADIGMNRWTGVENE